MDNDGLAFQGSLLIGVGGQLDGGDGAGLLGDDGPQTAIVVGYGDGEQGFKSAGVEVGEKDGAGVGIKAGRGAVAVGGDVEQNLGGICCAGDGNRRTVDGSAQLDVEELAGRVELLGF